MRPYSIALIMGGLFLALPAAPHLLSGQGAAERVEVAAAHWLREKVIPGHTAVLFDRRTSNDGRPRETVERNVDASRVLAEALGVPVATEGVRLACDREIGCLAPEGHTALGMERPEVKGSEATVSVFLLRRLSGAAQNDLAERYEIRLKRDGERWVVLGARVTVS